MDIDITFWYLITLFVSDRDNVQFFKFLVISSDSEPEGHSFSKTVNLFINQGLHLGIRKIFIIVEQGFSSDAIRDLESVKVNCVQ